MERNRARWRSSASGWRSAVSQVVASKKDALCRLVELLSDDECACLLKAVRDVAEGEHFWEDDCGLAYNEFVKLRRSGMAGGSPAAGPSKIPGGFNPIGLTKSCGAGERVMLPRLP